MVSASTASQELAVLVKVWRAPALKPSHGCRDAEDAVGHLGPLRNNRQFTCPGHAYRHHPDTTATANEQTGFSHLQLTHSWSSTAVWLEATVRKNIS